MEALNNKKIQITIGIAVTVILSIIGFTAKYTTAQNKIEERLCNLETKMTAIADTAKSLEDGRHSDDLRYTEIKVKLTSIEATLTEIKNKINK
jgi:septal ring factor EnvC (AmiA/AmiB activator)